MRLTHLLKPIAALTQIALSRLLRNSNISKQETILLKIQYGGRYLKGAAACAGAAFSLITLPASSLNGTITTDQKPTPKFLDTLLFLSGEAKSNISASVLEKALALKFLPPEYVPRSTSGPERTVFLGETPDSDGEKIFINYEEETQGIKRLGISLSESINVPVKPQKCLSQDEIQTRLFESGWVPGYSIRSHGTFSNEYTLGPNTMHLSWQLQCLWRIRIKYR